MTPYFALNETTLEPSGTLTGSAVEHHQERILRIHAIEVDDDGDRAELTVCGKIVNGAHHTVPFADTQIVMRCQTCAEALGENHMGRVR